MGKDLSNRAITRLASVMVRLQGAVGRLAGLMGARAGDASSRAEARNGSRDLTQQGAGHGPTWPEWPQWKPSRPRPFVDSNSDETGQLNVPIGSFTLQLAASLVLWSPFRLTQNLPSLVVGWAPHGSSFPGTAVTCSGAHQASQVTQPPR
jgi:hypothetical protein